MSGFKVNRFVAVAARRMTGVLGGALLVLALLAANSGWHQVLHHAGAPASNSCVLCLFAKGQVDMPELAVVVTGAVEPSFDLAPRPETIATIEVTYLAGPSRAPPVPACPLSVLA